MEFDEFIERYPEPVQDLARVTRAMLRTVDRSLEEAVDPGGGVIGYGYGPGYRNMIATIIPSQKGVKLGIVRGAELPDPKGLLEGSGKVHRHVSIADEKVAKSAAVKALVKARIAAWGAQQKS